MTSILGILNLTRDSFSDGGRYFDPARALEHARALVAAGAAIVDVGAESTHPDSEDVPAEAEIRRLTPVVEALAADGVAVSVDTVKPEVMRAMTALGVGYVNDVNGMRDPAAIAAVAASDARAIVMYSRAAGTRAERREGGVEGLLEELRAFFAERVQALTCAGVARERIIADPGMGFFLGAAPEPSLWVLRNLARLRSELDLPLLVSTSRKSFLGALTGRSVGERGAATLASEIWACLQGVEYIRTHEPGPLRDAMAVLDGVL